jgi:UDP:flavonoid glycosyltransferase YjiC (YdhE family)
VLGAAAHATPLVMAPIATDQHEMAEQVEQAGAGTICSTQPLSPTAVRESFRGLSANPAYSAAAARLREQILSMPTPADLLGRLKQLV